MRRSKLNMAVLFGASLLACGESSDPSPPGPGPLPVAELHGPSYRSHVQPMLDRLCAQASCHGSPDRLYRAYSRFSFRMPGHELENTLSEEELEANVEAVKPFLQGLSEIHESELLRKPLRGEAGGMLHGGGSQFYDRGDPSYVLWACWLLGGVVESYEECTP